jgi:hypothetical protein
MRNALIFSSSFVGHRQVYVFVIANILHRLGYKLIIAGNFSEILKSTFYFRKLESEINILKIDTASFTDNGLGITNKEFFEIQQKHSIELTIFTEADNHIPLFVSQLKHHNKRFLGRTVGIFLRPFYFYHNLSFMNKLRYIKHIDSVWESDMRLFHEVLNPCLKLIDVSLCIDDYFSLMHKHSIWLPDVFQQYADALVIEEHSEQRLWQNRLDKFKSENEGRNLLLYFGTEQQRRGYDQLLKLAVDCNACFIHCGLRHSGNNYEIDVNDLRYQLKKENRLFETNEYITDPICIEYFFKSVSHLVLPYDNFYGSSGVMLQALGYKIPVLVPDVGIIGYRVKKYNLGFTYSPGSLNSSYSTFINTSSEIFTDSIVNYMKLHSNEMLQSVLENAFKS